MFNTFKIAIRAIMLNKVRAFLTMLGVIIGVFSVVMLTGIGYGLQGYIEDQFESFGSNNIILRPGDSLSEGSFNPSSQMSSIMQNKLRYKHMREIEKLHSYVKYVVPMNNVVEKVSYKGETLKTNITISNEHIFEIMDLEVDKGSFFTKSDDNSERKVVVLGSQLAEDLFGVVNPVSKKIKIADQSFKVVGVNVSKGQSMAGMSYDDMVLMPFNTGAKVFDLDTVSEAIVKAKDKDKIDEAILAIEEVLAESLDEDEFSVLDQEEVLSMVNDILDILTIALGGIAAISLLVGGIGIMNIMLVSVTERTKEIGLRKALGATPKMILLQFLIEASLLSILGGLIGLALASIGVAIMQNFFPAKVTIESVSLALGVSTAVGLIFGVAPAQKAAKLSPIEALRYE